MKRAKHTKGPWRHHGEIINSDGREIAEVFAFKSDGETGANARLIAAAPEMLEALEILMRENQGAMFLNGTDGEMYSEWYVAREAIKRAKGE